MNWYNKKIAKKKKKKDEDKGKEKPSKHEESEKEFMDISGVGQDITQRPNTTKDSNDYIYI